MNILLQIYLRIKHFIFQGSKLKLSDSCSIMYFFMQDLKIYQIQRLMPDVSHKTLCNWFGHLRNCCSEVVEKMEIKMGNEVENQIIEIDESLFGKKRKYDKGAATTQYWVFGLAERSMDQPNYQRKVVMIIVSNRTKATLIPLIQKYVSRGATIYHDDWAAYKKLHEYGYEHGTVVHKREFKSADGVCTNLIEGLWGDIKMKIRSMHGVPMKDLQIYLNEYCYRFMFKDEHGSIYYPLMRDLAASK